MNEMLIFRKSPGELAPMLFFTKEPVAGFHRALIPPPLLIRIACMLFY
jgi:hypothetical protein